MHVSLLIGNNIIKLDAVDSTNTYAAALIKDHNVPEGTIIQAIHQTMGRGQMGTNWHSQPGESLTFSVILAPAFLRAEHQFYLNMAVSLGIHEYLRIKGIVATIKWPNDILVRGKKLAGILIENIIKGNYLQHCVIGIGLNVNSKSELMLPMATSLLVETGHYFDLDAELKLISESMDSYYTALRLQKFNSLKQDYMDRLMGVNSAVRIKMDKEEFDVKVVDIEISGRIVLNKLNNDVLKMGFKEFEWLY